MARRGVPAVQALPRRTRRDSTNAEVVSRAVEHAESKSAAGEMTLLADEALEHAIRESRAERARIQDLA